MFLVDILLGKRRIYRLRKKYDRMRERADKIKGRDARLSALRILDQVEPTLVMLEEQKVSRFERLRMTKYVDAGIKEAGKTMDENRERHRSKA